MSRHEIIKESIRNSVRLSELIERLTGEKIKGNKMCCPFHNETRPSFFVDDKKSVYNCFVCGGGDIFSFVMKYLGINFPQAIQFIDKEFHLSLTREPVSAKALVSNLRRNTEREQKERYKAQLDERYDNLCMEYRVAQIGSRRLEVFSDLWCYYVEQKIRLEMELDECILKMSKS